MVHSITYKRSLRCAVTSTAAANQQLITTIDEIPQEVDVVVIGSGVGGLSCASMLSRCVTHAALQHTLP